MKHNYLLLVIAIVCFTTNITAQQHCFTDEHQKKLIKAHPELAQAQADYEKEISEALKKIDYNKAARTTFTDQSGNEDFWYDIPIVVHIVHNYGVEYLTDDNIFSYVKDWNTVFAKQNADTVDVIPPFKKWIGNPHIRLHLAARDPLGNATKGITRHKSYLTYNGGDDAKYDDWPQSSYLNIWTINKMSGGNTGAAAYAVFPSSVSSEPYYDGVISLYDYAGTDKTINHEIGHCMNLYHIWGNTQVATECGDDGVDDTPPTRGHNVTGCQYALPSSNVNSTYDSACASNNFRLYTSASGGDSLINYPDTSNAQNIMDYTYCSRMFSKGQVERMHFALNNSSGSRNNLWDPLNLTFTGALDPIPDLKPKPEFSATPVGGTTSSTNYMDRLSYFTCPGTTVQFHNNSWNDTVTNLTWTFSNGATIPTSTSLTTVSNSFTTSGWVTVSMTASGNNSGDTTATWTKAVYVADVTATPAAGFVQSFGLATSDKWPSFNYYDNEFKWQIANTGLYDGYSMMYTGYDARVNPAMGIYPRTGNPGGDVDDFFSVPVDFSGYTPGFCSLTFDYSGASRSSNSLDITDEFDIDYSTNNAQSWHNLIKMTKGDLINKGAIPTPYFPNFASDWAHQSIAVPAAAMTNYTLFRFRYKPGNGQSGYSSGNNFYVDNFFISPFPAAVGNVVMNEAGITVVPNPTGGDAFVILKDAANTVANIVVTDVTGKVVYTTSQQVAGNVAQIEIPHSAISVKGLYIVQATTGSKTYTQKLVVY